MSQAPPIGDYREVIEKKILIHPRSLQTAIGPSELGTPCERKLGLKLSGAPEGEREAAWRPTVGTAVHAWLETAFTESGEVLADGSPRYVVEQRVNVGDYDGMDVSGSCDLFDRLTGTVLDWKIVGKTTLTKKKRHGPGEQYRAQAHLYGRGWARRGETVNEVVIAFLPASGELDEAVWWSEPWNEEVAVETLERADAIAAAGRILGWQNVLANLPKFDDYCQYCPYRTGTDTQTTCSGMPRKPAKPVTAASFLS